MNTPAKRAAARGRINRAARTVKEQHKSGNWLGVRLALAMYWAAKRDWERLV